MGEENHSWMREVGEESAYRQALRIMLESDFLCPECGIANQVPGLPTVRNIVLGSDWISAYCTNCDHEGLVPEFQWVREGHPLPS